MHNWPNMVLWSARLGAFGPSSVIYTRVTGGAPSFFRRRRGGSSKAGDFMHPITELPVMQAPLRPTLPYALAAGSDKGTWLRRPASRDICPAVRFFAPLHRRSIGRAFCQCHVFAVWTSYPPPSSRIYAKPLEGAIWESRTAPRHFLL